MTTPGEPFLVLLSRSPITVLWQGKRRVLGAASMSTDLLREAAGRCQQRAQRLADEAAMLRELADTLDAEDAATEQEQAALAQRRRAFRAEVRRARAEGNFGRDAEDVARHRLAEQNR